MSLAYPIPDSGKCDVSTWQIDEADLHKAVSKLEEMLDDVFDKIVRKHENRIAKTVVQNLMAAAKENPVSVNLCDENLVIYYPLKLDVESPFGPYEGEGVRYAVDLKTLIKDEMESSTLQAAVKILGYFEDMIAQLHKELPGMRLVDENEETS